MERPYFDIEASGRRMRDIRRARKISVRQVMEYMGFESTQAVYKWESGRCYPQADNLLALAKLYNVSPMELLVEEDSLSSSFFVEICCAKNHGSCLQCSAAIAFCQAYPFVCTFDGFCRRILKAEATIGVNHWLLYGSGKKCYSRGMMVPGTEEKTSGRNRMDLFLGAGAYSKQKTGKT